MTHHALRLWGMGDWRRRQAWRRQRRWRRCRQAVWTVL